MNGAVFTLKIDFAGNMVHIIAVIASCFLLILSGERCFIDACSISCGPGEKLCSCPFQRPKYHEPGEIVDSCENMGDIYCSKGNYVCGDPQDPANDYCARGKHILQANGLSELTTKFTIYIYYIHIIPYTHIVFSICCICAYDNL